MRRNRVVEHQVAHDRVGDASGVLDRCLALARGVSANFENVVVPTLYARSELIERVFGRLTQHALPGTEMNLRWRSALILAQVAHQMFCTGDAGTGRVGCLQRGVGAVGGLGGVRVGFDGF